MRKRCQEKKIFSRKGLSPILASVLLVALVIFLAMFVFLWTRGFISEQIEKFGQPVEALCSQVHFEVALVDSAFGTGTLEVVNKGTIDIYQFDVRSHLQGETEVETFKHSVSAGKSVSDDIYLNLDDGSVPEKIEVFAALVGNSGSTKKVFTCVDHGITVTL